LSLGKYIYTKFHTAAEKKADAEVPPTRKEFVAVREGLSDEPPVAADTNQLLPAAEPATAAAKI
jgi:hypothetical protein